MATIQNVYMLENEAARVEDADRALSPLNVRVVPLPLANAYHPEKFIQTIQPGSMFIYDVHIDPQGRVGMGDGVEAARLLGSELVKLYESQKHKPSQTRLGLYLLSFVTTDATRILNVGAVKEGTVLDANGNPARAVGKVVGIEGIDVTYRKKHGVPGSDRTVTYGQTVAQLVQDAERHYNALLAKNPLPNSPIRILNPSWVRNLEDRLQGQGDDI
ncbi:hypothetical protein HYV86_07570 [Candidatus Woesearchaeota archaeon]|nr:hypothetical protein [Candidatus Woesearchaeota archaeon]